VLFIVKIISFYFICYSGINGLVFKYLPPLFQKNKKKRIIDKNSPYKNMRLFFSFSLIFDLKNKKKAELIRRVKKMKFYLQIFSFVEKKLLISHVIP
jgi:hypothetical protein